MSDNVREIEIDIDACKEVIDLMRALDNLWDHPDFKKVIREGYFETFAASLVMQKAQPGLQEAAQQAGISKSIDAIGELYEYFRGVKHRGMMAQKSLADHEQTREELLAEEV